MANVRYPEPSEVAKVVKKYNNHPKYGDSDRCRWTKSVPAAWHILTPELGLFSVFRKGEKL